jgi:hypothetical protein
MSKKIKAKLFSSLFFSLLLASGLEITNTKNVLASSCDPDNGTLFHDGQGEFNKKTVKVIGYSWAHGSCQKFFTSPNPQIFTRQLGWRDGCEGSYGNCGEMFYLLDDEEVNVIGEFSGSKVGYKIQDSRGKVFTLVIYNQ